jgi:hypothetical protein
MARIGVDPMTGPCYPNAPANGSFPCLHSFANFGAKESRLIFAHAALDFRGGKLKVTHPQPLVARLPKVQRKFYQGEQTAELPVDVAETNPHASVDGQTELTTDPIQPFGSLLLPSGIARGISSAKIELILTSFVGRHETETSNQARFRQRLSTPIRRAGAVGVYDWSSQREFTTGLRVNFTRAILLAQLGHPAPA